MYSSSGIHHHPTLFLMPRMFCCCCCSCRRYLSLLLLYVRLPLAPPLHTQQAQASWRLLQAATQT